MKFGRRLMVRMVIILWLPLGAMIVSNVTGWCHGDDGHEDPACCALCCTTHYSVIPVSKVEIISIPTAQVRFEEPLGRPALNFAGDIFHPPRLTR